MNRDRGELRECLSLGSKFLDLLWSSYEPFLFTFFAPYYNHEGKPALLTTSYANPIVGVTHAQIEVTRSEVTNY